MPVVEAKKRLTKEFKNLQKNPVPYITARPNESNILEWHYIIDGPPDTPYYNGQYHGTLIFTSSYPYAPPAVRMYTPSGRFQPRTRLCLSLSDFHPESWNPGWSVSTILVGLLSFMTGDDVTTGSITTSDETKIMYAKKSLEFNVSSNPDFRKIFPDYVKSNMEGLSERLKEIEDHQDKKLNKAARLQAAIQQQQQHSKQTTTNTNSNTKKTGSSEDEIRAKKNAQAQAALANKNKNNATKQSSTLKQVLIPIFVVAAGLFFVKIKTGGA